MSVKKSFVFAIVLAGLLLTAGVAWFRFSPKYDSGRGWQSLFGSYPASNEGAAANSLHNYTYAQEKFLNYDLDYDGIKNYAPSFTKLYNLKDKAGNRIDLINPSMGTATSPNHRFKGYYFVDIKTWAAKRDGYGLCAVPAEYGKTGRNVFIINTKGTIYHKDFGASKEITEWPDVMDGWQMM